MHILSRLLDCRFAMMALVIPSPSDNTSRFAAVKPDKPEIRGLGQEGEPASVAIPRIKLVLLGDSVRSQYVLPLALIDIKRTATSCKPAVRGQYTKKCILQGVGKSCLVLRYVRGQFDPSSKVTVGAAFMSHSVHLQDGTTVKFEIWSASMSPLHCHSYSPIPACNFECLLPRFCSHAELSILS